MSEVTISVGSSSFPFLVTISPSCSIFILNSSSVKFSFSNLRTIELSIAFNFLKVSESTENCPWPRTLMIFFFTPLADVGFLGELLSALELPLVF